MRVCGCVFLCVCAGLYVPVCMCVCVCVRQVLDVQKFIDVGRPGRKKCSMLNVVIGRNDFLGRKPRVITPLSKIKITAQINT